MQESVSAEVAEAAQNSGANILSDISSKEYYSYLGQEPERSVCNLEVLRTFLSQS